MELKNFILYPIINDAEFYRALFAIVGSLADNTDSNDILRDLANEMKKFKISVGLFLKKLEIGLKFSMYMLLQF